MTKEKPLSEKYETAKRIQKIMLITILILCVGCIWQAFMLLRCQILYDEAIELEAEDIVTCLQMVTACVELGNVTHEEIASKVINDYIWSDFEE